MTARRLGWMCGIAMAMCASVGWSLVDRAGARQAAPAPSRDDSPARETTEQQIAAMIESLGDPVYATRTEAMRRLLTIGMPAAAQLRVASTDDHVEVALRAQKLLIALDHLLFSGVDIQLDCSTRRLEWNDTLELRVLFTNRSAYPARIPFETDKSVRQAMNPDSLQVADMLDLAEWLTVLGPDGEPIDLRVDDIGLDPQVQAAVERRVTDSPVTILPPGEHATITAGALNRGWARFPLLERGDYAISLTYTPQWNDPVLEARRAGVAGSNTLVVTVTQPAPPTVSRRGVEAIVAITREGDTIVARLTNRMDLPAHINLNFGVAAPFAQATWVLSSGDRRQEWPFLPQGNQSWQDFRADRLVEVQPGEAIELLRAKLDELQAALANRVARARPQEWQVHLRYQNLCDRRWQRRQGEALADNDDAPAVLRRPLARNVLATHQTSNRIDLSPKR